MGNEGGGAPVYHGKFFLVANEFTDCASFEHGGKGFVCLTIPLNEIPQPPPQPVVGDITKGDVLIRVCRDKTCDKSPTHGAHGLVHQYTAFLNKCSEFGSKGSSKRNGKYLIVGATASTLKPGVKLTADHCNTGGGAPVYHGKFSLVVNQFTDCASFEHGGKGFVCFTCPLNEIPQPPPPPPQPVVGNITKGDVL